MTTPTPLHPVATTQAGEPNWEIAFERHCSEQGKIFGMPGLSARPCFKAGYDYAIEMQASHSAAADVVPVDEQYWPHVKALADILDYLKGFPDSRCAPEIKAICREALSFRPTAPASEDKDAIIKDLSALVNRLSLALKNVAPGHELPQKAGEYLKRKDLTSPLRTLGDRVREANAPAPFPKKGN